MRIVIILLLGLVALAVNAEVVLPHRCKPLTLENETIKFLTNKPTFVMIYNRSKMNIWLNHPTSDPGASAGWSSCLAPGNWSALALNQKGFKLRCVESKPGHEQHVPCASVLTFCQWSGVKRPMADKGGNYWAGENQSLNALMGSLEQRGFKIPQSVTHDE